MQQEALPTRPGVGRARARGAESTRCCTHRPGRVLPADRWDQRLSCVENANIRTFRVPASPHLRSSLDSLSDRAGLWAGGLQAGLGELDPTLQSTSSRPRGLAPSPQRGPCTNLFINLTSTSGSVHSSVCPSSLPCCCSCLGQPYRSFGLSCGAPPPHTEPGILGWGSPRVLTPRTGPPPPLWDPASLLMGPSAPRG